MLTAVLLGYAIYRGGLKINLQKFFKITAVILVLVAAGLLAGAVHTGHEAGWVNVFQERALDLTWLVKPGSVQSALITGMFGIQPEPTVGEVFVWLAYAIPMTIYVLRPTRRRRAEHRRVEFQPPGRHVGLIPPEESFHRASPPRPYGRDHPARCDRRHGGCHRCRRGGAAARSRTP